MAAGLGLLRLSPHDFWGMTPVEFERAVSVILPARAERPDRNRLADLMAAFPDTIER